MRDHSNQNVRFFASYFKHVRKIAELTIQNARPDFSFRLYLPISEIVGGLWAKKKSEVNFNSFRKRGNWKECNHIHITHYSFWCISICCSICWLYCMAAWSLFAMWLKNFNLPREWPTFWLACLSIICSALKCFGIGTYNLTKFHIWSLKKVFLKFLAVLDGWIHFAERDLHQILHFIFVQFYLLILFCPVFFFFSFKSF